jgi:hypothetical protein
MTTTAIIAARETPKALATIAGHKAHVEAWRRYNITNSVIARVREQDPDFYLPNEKPRGMYQSELDYLALLEILPVGMVFNPNNGFNFVRPGATKAEEYRPAVQEHPSFRALDVSDAVMERWMTSMTRGSFAKVDVPEVDTPEGQVILERNLPRELQAV